MGLQVTQQRDRTRTFRAATDALGRPHHGDRDRPIQSLMWYPAQPSRQLSMTVADYAQLSAAETHFEKPRMSRSGREWLDGMRLELGTPMRAVRNAIPSAGRFPVVIYAPGFSRPAWENADLCEYLASHGYLVIASPSMGARTRNMTSDLEGLEAQARDISFLISCACVLPCADVSQLAVAGYSWGGLSNLFAAVRDSRVGALLALDGSMRYWSSLIKQAGYVNLDEISIPMIYFAQGAVTMEDQARDLRCNEGPSVLNSWIRGDLTTAYMLGMSHAGFASMFQRNEDLWKLEHAHGYRNDNFGREDEAVGYAWMARYALEFLNAYLKGDPGAKAFLQRTPKGNGVPRYVMNASHRPAVGRPLSLETFRAELGRQGFEQIAAIYSDFRKRAPEFQLSDEQVNTWAEELLDDNHLCQATTLLSFHSQMNPESSVIHTTLGDAYRLSGQVERAVSSYRLAIDKDARNAEAIWKLNQISRDCAQ